MKNTLILGGSTGIGLDTARRLVSAGEKVTLVGRSEQKLAAASKQLSDLTTGDVRTISADLYDLGSVDELIDTLTTGDVPYDALVNSAGYFFPKGFLEHNRDDYRKYTDLNESFFFLTQAVAKRMIADGRQGSVVNIGSMWAKQAIKATPSSAYSMAKAGLHSLTQLPLDESDHHRMSVPSWPFCSAKKPAG